MVKNLPANAGNSGDMGLIPGLGRSPRVGRGNPIQYSCLDNSMDRGAWRAIVHGVTESRTQLSDFPSLLLTLGFMPFPQFQLSEVEVNHLKPFFISAEVFGDVFPSKHNFAEFHNFYLFFHLHSVHRAF